VRLAKKKAIQYSTDVNAILIYILDNYTGSYSKAEKLDFSVFEVTPEPGVTLANGKRFKKALRQLTEEFVKSTGVIGGSSDVYGQSLVKDLETNLDLVIDEFLARLSKHRGDINKVEKLQVSREDFDWAADVLGVDRRKTGDYGEALQMQLVRKRFRTAAAEVHPDRNPSDDAKEVFLNLNRALEILDLYNSARA
jgi:hypothetical protein